MAKTSRRPKIEPIISFSEKTASLQLDDLLKAVEPNFRSSHSKDLKEVPTNSTALCLAIVAALFAIFGITAAGTVIIPIMKGSPAWAIWQVVCAVVLIKAGLLIVRGVKCAMCSKHISKEGCSKNC